MPRYPCPCCGYVEFGDPSGGYEICPICFWENDPVQLADPWFAGGANVPNLVDAQQSFLRIGATEERFTGNVRGPTANDRKDPNWRIVQSIDKAYVTTPREIEANARQRGTRESYYYWIRSQ